AKVERMQDSVRVKVSDLRGIEIDARDIPDLVPICAVLGCFADGETRIANANRLRIKESDRLRAITQELRKMGADIRESGGGLIINGRCKLKGAVLDPHDDHRIAMSCAIAALSAEGETVIENPECVRKSYPNFFEDLEKLGASIDWGEEG
ncbi:MAG: 3-phosphoshikimate 1-carboxyvinyltransferase, partial [Candidatus Altiarchaeales archaeon]